MPQNQISLSTRTPESVPIEINAVVYPKPATTFTYRVYCVGDIKARRSSPSRVWYERKSSYIGNGVSVYYDGDSSSKV